MSLRNLSPWLGLIIGTLLPTGRGAAQVVPKDSAPLGSRLAERGPAGPVRVTFECVVSRIVDGDTIECRTIGRVRLIGMDTPERDQEPFGGMAAEALGGLVPIDSTTRLEPDVGWAVTLTYPPNVQYVDWFTAAQQRAREEGRGLWAIGGFDCLPVDRRQRRC